MYSSQVLSIPSHTSLDFCLSGGHITPIQQLLNMEKVCSPQPQGSYMKSGNQDLTGCKPSQVSLNMPHNHIDPFSLVSQFVPRQILIDLCQEQDSDNRSQSVQELGKKENGIISKQINRFNFQTTLRQKYSNKPLISFHEFIDIVKQCYQKLPKQDQQLFHINKKWCHNLLQQFRDSRLDFKTTQSKPKFPTHQTPEEDDQVSSEYDYDSDIEPIECTIPNVSKVWRDHIKQLLEQKYQTKKLLSDSKMDQNQSDVIIINKTMKKTLENSRDQLERIKNYIKNLDKTHINSKIYASQQSYDRKQAISPKLDTKMQRKYMECGMQQEIEAKEQISQMNSQ